jgi:putative membrane protein
MNKEIDNKTPEQGSDKTSPPAQAAQKDNRAGDETRTMKILTGIASALGFDLGKRKKQNVETGDVGTQLAHQRTDLAMERNYLAAERTLMGWIRTALSMISFGFTIGKLGQVLHDVEVKGFVGPTRTVSIENIAYFLVILGTLALLGASLQHWCRMRELYAMGFSRKVPLTFIVSLLLVIVGGFAFTSMILAL